MPFTDLPREARPERRAALLSIDVQSDFATPLGSAEVAGTADAVPNMARLVQAFRAQGLPIVHVLRLYEPDGSNAELVRRERLRQQPTIAAPGTTGARVVDELLPPAATWPDDAALLAGHLMEIGPNEWLMYKPRWSAFYETPLAAHLESFRIDSVIVCGCNYPNCPRATLFDATQHDLKAAIATDATSGIDDRGIAEMQNIGVGAETTSTLVGWLAEDV